MRTPMGQSFDAETERQRRIEELIAEYGPNWSEQHDPGSFSCHELLDRTAYLADNLERLLLEHPACIQNQAWYALAEQAAAALRELYQQIGALHLQEESHISR